LKAARILKKKCAILLDLAVICKEMNLRKCVQFSGGELIGRDKDGDFVQKIIVFIIQALKKSIPMAIKACLEKNFCYVVGK